ncbi:hypothetical protein BsWGS_08700 [Bradybaena similaris]
MAKPREKIPVVELSSAFQKKADLEFERLRETVARNLKQEMLGLLEDELHSDLLITNGTVSVRAHRCIVQARSRHLWQDSWLTQKPDPDTNSDMSCLEMPGLNAEQLTQFARQLYSVSDTVLLLEEFINYMPRGKLSSSHLEARFDSVMSADLDHSKTEHTLCPNVGIDTGKEYVTNERTSQTTDVDNRKKERSGLPVKRCKAVDNNDDRNRMNIFRGQIMPTESKIVSLPDMPTESQAVCTESKNISSADIPIGSKIASLSKLSTESKIAALLDDHVENRYAQAESVMVQIESKFVLPSDGPRESKNACTESKILSSADIPIKSKTISSPGALAESKIACTESKIVSSFDIPIESKIILSPGALAESKNAHKVSQPAQGESKCLTSPDLHMESKTAQEESTNLSQPEVRTEIMIAQRDNKGLLSFEVQTDSNAVRAESKSLSSPEILTESKTAQGETKDVLNDSKTSQGESKDISLPEVHTESMTAHRESKDVSKTSQGDSKDALTDSKTLQGESKDVSLPEVHTESKTSQGESKDALSDSKTSQGESKDVSLPEGHTESKTAQGESKDVSKTSQGEGKNVSKASQGESKDVSKTSQGESKDVCKTSQGESKDVSKTSQGESKDVSKTSQGESKDASLPEVHTESKTARGESKDVSKTSQGESKDASLPEVHTESKTARGESKDVSKTSQGEGKDVSKASQGESKDVSKTSQGESKDVSKASQGESKDVSKASQGESKDVCKTSQGESKDVSKTSQGESKDVSKTSQGESKDVSKTSQGKSKNVSLFEVHTESKTAQGESKGVLTQSKMSQGESKDVSLPEVHTESKTAHGDSKRESSPDIHTQSMSVQAESKGLSSLNVHTESKITTTESQRVSAPDIHTESKTLSAINNTEYTENEAVTTDSKIAHVLQPASLSSQMSENCEIPSSSSAYGLGTEHTDCQVHSEEVPSSVCSDRDLIKPQLVHEMISCSIFGKERLELMDYIQLEASIVGSECLEDGASVDPSVGGNLVSSGSLHDSTGNKDIGNEDGHLPMSSQILAETSEAAGDGKASLFDLVASDSASEQYKACSPLGKDLLSMYLHKDNCDCCLSVDGVHFMAHKCVLSARCEYFLAMFGGQWSESQMATVNLEAVSPQAVKQLLLFLYGGVINLCVPSNLKELFIIADMYGVLTFRTVLTFYVKKDLCHFFHKPCPACVTTTSEALMLCHIFHLEDLQTRCLRWMAKYFTKIWPTKAFSSLEDSIHQLCFESILSEMTASNVLDIIIECNKLVSSLPRIKWTETVLYLVTRLMDAAIEYTSSHFVDVLKTKEFLLWAQVASWKAAVLEEIFYSVINSLPVDTACLVFQTLIKLQELHSNPENSDVEITGLLQAMIKCCEKFFRTHIHHVTRSKQWSVLPPQVQAQILEVSAYVYLPEPPGSTPSRSAASKAPAGRHERTLPIGITGARSRGEASSMTISAPSRTTLTARAHSGRHTDKSHETRMSRSISESLPSRSKRAASKGTEVKVRASSRDRHRTDSHLHPGSLGRNDIQDSHNLPDSKLGSARDENQGSVLPNASHFGFQPYSQSSRPGAYFMSKTETKKGKVRSPQDGLTEKVLETEDPGSSFQLSSSLKLALSSQPKSGSGTKKLSPVGQKSHMTSKLPTLIRSQRQSSRPQSLYSTHSEVMAPECSSSTDIELMPSEYLSSTNNEVIASECPPSKSSEAMPPDPSSSKDTEGIPPECPSTSSSEMMPSGKITRSALVELVSTNTAGESSISVRSITGKMNVLPAAPPVVDGAFCDLSVDSSEPVTAPSKDLPLNISEGNDDHPIKPVDSSEHLSNNPQTVFSPDGPENSNSNSEEPSTAETSAMLNFSSYTSDAILSDRAGHMTADLDSAEVKIVHMSKTLNVGFIVPPD